MDFDDKDKDLNDQKESSLDSKPEGQPFSREWLNEDEKHGTGLNYQTEDETEPGGSMPERVVEDVSEEAEEVGIHADNDREFGPKPLNSTQDLNFNAHRGDVPDYSDDKEE